MFISLPDLCYSLVSILSIFIGPYGLRLVRMWLCLCVFVYVTHVTSVNLQLNLKLISFGLSHSFTHIRSFCLSLCLHDFSIMAMNENKQTIHSVWSFQILYWPIHTINDTFCSAIQICEVRYFLFFSRITKEKGNEIETTRRAQRRTQQSEIQ